MSRASHNLSAAPAAALVTDPAGGRRVAFQRARRHSRRVRLLKVSLPIVVALGLCLALLTVWLDPLRYFHQIPIEFSNISISGNRLNIEAPRLKGYTRDRHPYTVVAQSASQDLRQPDLVELADIQGLVELGDGSQTNMRAPRGLYNVKSEQMRLTGSVEIETTGGYQMRLQDAFVEVREGRISTENPVNAVFPDGTLQAQRLTVYEHGARVVFAGGVTMVLQPPRPAGSETVDATQAETRRAEAKR